MRRLSTTSDVEGFAAAAFVLYVRIVELESLVEALARKVELGAVEIRQAFRVDDDVDAVALEVQILGPDLVDEFELVRESRAAGGANAQTHADALAALLENARHVPGRAFGQRDRHCPHRPFKPRPRRLARCRRRLRCCRRASSCNRPPPP